MPDAEIRFAEIRFDRNRAGTRLRTLVAPELAEDESLVGWTRAWISREGRYNALLAARHRDFVVVSDQRLLLYSCGFFTRWPKRKVYEARRQYLAVEDTGRRPCRRLQVTGFRKRTLRCEFGRDPASRAIVDALLGEAYGAVVTSP